MWGWSGGEFGIENSIDCENGSQRCGMRRVVEWGEESWSVCGVENGSWVWDVTCLGSAEMKH